MAIECHKCVKRATQSCTSYTLFGNECVKYTCDDHPCLCKEGEKRRLHRPWYHHAIPALICLGIGVVTAFFWMLYFPDAEMGPFEAGGRIMISSLVITYLVLAWLWIDDWIYQRKEELRNED